MADKKISELPADSSLSGTEQFPVNDGGVTKRVTTAQMKAFAEADALAAASAAQGTANTALANAATAQGTANTANGKADTALANAASAQGTANTANGTANTALANAATAQGTANAALGNAASAQNTANTAIGNAAAAQSTANNAQNTATAALNSAVAANSRCGVLEARNLVQAVMTYSGFSGTGFSAVSAGNTLGARGIRVDAGGVSPRVRIQYTGCYKNNNNDGPNSFVLYRVRGGSVALISTTPFSTSNDDSTAVCVVGFSDSVAGDVFYVQANTTGGYMVTELMDIFTCP